MQEPRPAKQHIAISLPPQMQVVGLGPTAIVSSLDANRSWRIGLNDLCRHLDAWRTPTAREEQDEQYCPQTPGG